MNILAIDLRLADLEHALGIEPYIAQRAIQRQDRSGGQRNRLRLYRRAQCAQRYAQEKESAGLRTNHQFEVQRHECLIKDATGGGCLSSRGGTNQRLKLSILQGDNRRPMAEVAVGFEDGIFQNHGEARLKQTLHQVALHRPE